MIGKRSDPVAERWPMPKVLSSSGRGFGPAVVSRRRGRGSQAGPLPVTSRRRAVGPEEDDDAPLPPKYLRCAGSFHGKRTVFQSVVGMLLFL